MENSQNFLTENLVNPLWNEKSLDVIEHFFAENVDVRTTFVSGVGPEILRKSVQDTFEIFPNLSVNIDEVLQEGKKHIYKWTGSASHKGSLMGLPPTGCDIQFSGVVFGEIEQGYITTYHSFSNIPQVLQNLYSLQQLQAANQDPSFVAEKKYSSGDLYQAIKQLARFPLTRREIECLSAWIRGCTIKESAKRMGGLSERTIQTYRENIKKKFGVYNYQQVLQIIQNNGLLPQLM